MLRKNKEVFWTKSVTNASIARQTLNAMVVLSAMSVHQEHRYDKIENLKKLDRLNIT